MPRIRIQLSGQPIVLQVPDGMDPGAFAEQVEQRHAAQPGYSAADPSSFENFAAGVGAGALNVGRQVGNMVGLVDDETIAQQRVTDRDLEATGAGFAGKMAGEIAATAPVGMGAVKGLHAAGRILPKALSGPLAAMTAEGAGTGALMAGPENRGGGAAGGAAISGALGTTGKVLKRMMAKPWVTKTPAAKNLQKTLGVDVPLSHSTPKGSAPHQMYKDIVSNIPFGGGKIHTQYNEALDAFRLTAAQKALPPGVSSSALHKGNMQEVMGVLADEWKKAYKFDFNDIPINLGKVDDYALPNIPEKHLKRMWPDSVSLPRPGDTVDGAKILGLRTTAQDVIDDLPSKERGYKKALVEWREGLDDVLQKNFDLPDNPDLQKEYQRFTQLNEPYRRFKDVQMAASKDPASNFTPKQLLRATNKRAGVEGASGGGAMNDFAKMSDEVLGEKLGNKGVFQTTAATGAAGGVLGAGAGLITAGLIGGATGAGIGIPVAIAGAAGAASPKVQRAMAGELASQQALAAMLRKIQKPVEALGRHATRGAVIGVTR